MAPFQAAVGLGCKAYPVAAQECKTIPASAGNLTHQRFLRHSHTHAQHILRISFGCVAMGIVGQNKVNGGNRSRCSTIRTYDQNISDSLFYQPQCSGQSR